MRNQGISNDISNHQKLKNSSTHITNGQNEAYGLKGDLRNNSANSVKGTSNQNERTGNKLPSSPSRTEANEYISCPGNKSNIMKEESMNINEISLIEESLCQSSVNSLDKTCSSYPGQTSDLFHSVSTVDPVSNSNNNNSSNSSSNNLKQKFNNTIANSVRRLNSKFENITSLFDSKTKSSNSYSVSDVGKRRGSLKNSLNVSSDRKKQLLSAFSTDRSISYEDSVNFKSTTGGSVSVATSPTILKKNVFVSRYMAHIESKKYWTTNPDETEQTMVQIDFSSNLVETAYRPDHDPMSAFYRRVSFSLSVVIDLKKTEFRLSVCLFIKMPFYLHRHFCANRLTCRLLIFVIFYISNIKVSLCSVHLLFAFFCVFLLLLSMVFRGKISENCAFVKKGFWGFIFN